MSPIYFVVIFFYITIKQSVAKSSPVLIYGLKLPVRDVFPTIKTDEFKEMMKEYVNDFAFFVTLEENFHARQLSCKSVTLADCYSIDFPESDNYTFYGSVDNALDALQELFNSSVPAEVDNEGKLKSMEYCEEGYNSKLNILRLAGNSSTNFTLLTLRTDFMRDVSENLKNCDLTPLFFFTANVADDIQYDDDGDESRLLVKGVSTTIVGDVVVVDVATKKHKLFKITESELKNITFKIMKKPGKYTQVNATYDGEEYQGRKLKWPTPFNLNAPELIFAKGNKKLRINKLQLERFSAMEKNVKGLEYGDDWHTCVYVTPGILMGLFVVAILGTFIYWGITMLMDIQTNDRFDGPQMQLLQFANIEN